MDLGSFRKCFIPRQKLFTLGKIPIWVSDGSFLRYCVLISAEIFFFHYAIVRFACGICLYQTNVRLSSSYLLDRSKSMSPDFMTIKPVLILNREHNLLYVFDGIQFQSTEDDKG